MDDGGSMTTLSVYTLDPMEQGISLTTCKFIGIEKEYFVVGTARVIPEEQEPSIGRILVFEILGDRDGEGENRRRHNLAMELDVKGAVFSIVNMNGKIVAGIGSKVNSNQFFFAFLFLFLNYILIEISDYLEYFYYLDVF